MKQVKRIMVAAITALLGLAGLSATTADFVRYVDFTVADGAVGEGVSVGNVPVLVRLSTAIDGFSYADFRQENGADLLFVGADGAVLPHEVDTWNPSGESLVWVKMPKVETGATLRAYFGSSETVESTATAVWSDYVGVWHLGESGGNAIDSTGHGLDGTPSGERAAQMIGVSDGAVGVARLNSPDGGKAYLSIPSYDEILSAMGRTDVTHFTMSGWVKAISVNGYARIFSRKETWDAWEGFECEFSDGQPNKINVRGGSDKGISVSVPNATESWVHLALAYQWDQLAVYVNGAKSQEEDNDVHGNINCGGNGNANNGKPLSIGCDSNGDEASLIGYFDELRLYAETVGADRQTVEYNAMANRNFLSASSVVTLGGVIVGVQVEPDVFGAGFTVRAVAKEASDETKLLLRIGESASELGESVELAPRSSEETSRIFIHRADGLRPQTTYFYSVEFVEEGETLNAVDGSFTTQAESGFGQPGLWQGRCGGTLNTTTPLSDSDVPIVRAYGPIMGLSQVQNYETAIHNDVDGHDYYWGDSMTWIYAGYMWLEGGVEYRFFSKQDDDGRVVLDGTTVVESRSCGEAQGNFTPSYTGWHPIEVRVGNGGGYAGNNGGPGVGYKVNVDGNDFVKLLDDGTGSLLMCLPLGVAQDSLSVVSSLNSQGTVTAMLATDFTVPVAVYAWCGANYGGNDPDAWTTKTQVATCDGTGAEQKSVQFTLPEDAGYVRFVAVDANGNPCAAATTLRVSDIQTAGSAPTLANARVTDVGCTNAAFEVEVLSPGSQNDWTVRVAYGECGKEFALSTALGSGSGVAVFAGELQGLLPSRRYRAKLVVNNGNEETESETLTFDTDAGTAETLPDPLTMLDDVFSPQFAFVQTVSDIEKGDTLTVSDELVYPASSCDLAVEVSRTGDFDDMVDYSCESAAAAATVTRTLHSDDKESADYIRPGETVYVRMRATDGAGHVGYSPTSRVTPYGAPVVGTPNVNLVLFDATFSGTLSAIGAGENLMQLYVGTSENDLGPVGTKTAVAADGSYAIGHSFGAYGTYCCKLVVESACTTESWTAESPLIWLTASDTCTYVWKGEVTSGSWSDPANWKRSIAGGQPSFPNSTECTVSFEECAEPTVVTIGGRYDVGILRSGRENLVLKLVGTGEVGVENRLSVNDWENGFGFAKGTDITFSHLDVYGNTKLNPPADGFVRLHDGSRMELRREYWYVDGSQNAVLELKGKSTYVQGDWTFRVSYGYGKVIIDDSTFTGGYLNLEQTSATEGFAFVFMGENPRLITQRIANAENFPLTLEFNVPTGGYKEPPISILNGNEIFNTDRATVKIRIDPASSSLKQGKAVTKLIDWPKTIRKDFFDLAQPAKYASRTSFMWTYGSDDSENPSAEGDLPTGLWTTVRNAGFCVFVR